MKKYISLSLCLIVLFTALIFTMYYFSNLSQSKSINSIVAGDILHEKPPEPSDENQVSVNLSQPILFAGFIIEAQPDPSPPNEGEAS